MAEQIIFGADIDNQSFGFYERWEFKPYVVEDFNGKLTVSPQTYTEGTL